VKQNNKLSLGLKDYRKFGSCLNPGPPNKHFVFYEAGNLWSTVPAESLWLLLQDFVLAATKNLNALFRGVAGRWREMKQNFGAAM
jgi:hypothetical protein